MPFGGRDERGGARGVTAVVYRDFLICAFACRSDARVRLFERIFKREIPLGRVRWPRLRTLHRVQISRQ